MLKPTRHHSQIIGRLREAEVLLERGYSLTQACRQIGVDEWTYTQWWKQYREYLTDTTQVRRLEHENVRLRAIIGAMLGMPCAVSVIEWDDPETFVGGE